MRDTLGFRKGFDALEFSCLYHHLPDSILEFKPRFLPYSAVDSSYVAFRSHVFLHISKMAISNLYILQFGARCFCEIQSMFSVFARQIDSKQGLESFGQPFHISSLG